MKGPHATTLALTLAAAGALGYLAWDAGRGATTDEARARPQHLFETFRPDEVRAVRVRPKEGPAFSLRRGGEGPDGRPAWTLEAEGAAPLPASRKAVEQLVGSLEFGRYEREVEPGAVERARFGLETPEARFEIDMGEEPRALRLGGPAASPEGGRYAEVEGRGVYVITKELAAALETRLDAFRARALLEGGLENAASVSLEGEGGTRRFERAPWAPAAGGRGAGFRWDGSTPEGKVRVARAPMAKLIAALRDLEASRFLSVEEAEKSLAAAEARVVVRIRTGEAAAAEQVVEVGGACPEGPGRVAIRKRPSPVAACVPEDAAEALTTPAGAFVDLGLGGAEVDEISEVRVASGPVGRGEEVIELARAGTGWRVRQGKQAGQEIDGEIGDAVVAGIAEAEARRLAEGDPEELGLEPPAGRVRLVSALPDPSAEGGDRERVEELTVGRPKGDTVFVRRHEDGVLLALPKETGERLLPSELLLRSRRVLDFVPARVARLRLERAGRPAQRLERRDGRLALVEPPGLGADARLVADVLALVSNLRTPRWVAERPGPEHGLSSPRVALEIELEGEGEGDAGAKKGALRLLVGSRTADGQGAFASLDAGDGKEAVFVLPLAVERAMNLLLADRSALVVDPARLRRARLRRGPTELVLERGKEAWRLSGNGAEADPARAAAIHAALGDLHAEAVVRAGPPSPAEGFARPEAEIVLEPESGPPVTLTIGAGDVFRGTRVRYVRRAGTPATFAVAQARLAPILEALGAR